MTDTQPSLPTAADYDPERIQALEQECETLRARNHQLTSELRFASGLVALLLLLGFWNYWQGTHTRHTDETTTSGNASNTPQGLSTDQQTSLAQPPSAPRHSPPGTLAGTPGTHNPSPQLAQRPGKSQPNQGLTPQLLPPSPHPRLRATRHTQRRMRRQYRRNTQRQYRRNTRQPQRNARQNRRNIRQNRRNVRQYRRNVRQYRRNVRQNRRNTRRPRFGDAVPEHLAPASWCPQGFYYGFYYPCLARDARRRCISRSRRKKYTCLPHRWRKRIRKPR